MSIQQTGRLPIFAACLLLVACGGGGSGDGSDPFDPFSTSWRSTCLANGGNGFRYSLSFDQSDSSFLANSASSFDLPDCSGDAGRFGRNVLRGNYTIGSEVIAPGGFAATQVDFAHDPLIDRNRNAATPADFDLVYFDAGTNLIYLGAKTDTLDGSSAASRPTSIDFNNVWTPN